MTVMFLNRIFNKLLNMLPRIVFAGELHVTFNRSLKVERNVAAKKSYLLENCVSYSKNYRTLDATPLQRNHICWRIASRIQTIIECHCKELYSQENCVAYSRDR
uniref:Uncharacterized protein n=1 Tax=viral metagenome TaxID=1070528 RepID=A0A6C0C778_9ZZZZ